MCLRQFWKFRNFLNFGNFWIIKWAFWRNDLKYSQLFFVIFSQVDVFYIWEEFEVYGMRPNKSTKSGQKGAHRLNCKIFVHFEAIFEIYDKNSRKKKNHVSPTILKFSWSNLYGSYRWTLLGSIEVIRCQISAFVKNSQVLAILG